MNPVSRDEVRYSFPTLYTAKAGCMMMFFERTFAPKKKIREFRLPPHAKRKENFDEEGVGRACEYYIIIYYELLLQ